MSRHAFLIIAHDNFSVLERLLTALSHPDVDIYLHLDAKVKQMPALGEGNPHLHLVGKRVDTRWGDISQIETEYALLEAAYKEGVYSYYHIISGTHFPLMPIEDILLFFNRVEGKSVFHNLCVSTPYQEWSKLRTYNLFTRHIGYGPDAVRRICQVLNRIGHRIQGHLRIERNRQITFHKASNWASLTEEAVRLLIDRKALVMKTFRYTFCGDEYFAPTVLMHSDLQDKILSYDQYLKLEMGEANPRVLCLDDYDTLAGSGCLFARKFDDKHLDLVERIQHLIER